MKIRPVGRKQKGPKNVFGLWDVLTTSNELNVAPKLPDSKGQKRGQVLEKCCQWMEKLGYRKTRKYLEFLTVDSQNCHSTYPPSC